MSDLVAVLIFLPMFGIRSSVNNWWGYGCAPSPLNEAIKDVALLGLCSVVELVDLEGSHSASWDNIAIGLQNPLGHLISGAGGRSKDTAKDLAVVRELLLVLSKVAPVIPFVLAEVGNVTFFASSCGMRVCPV